MDQSSEKRSDSPPFSLLYLFAWVVVCAVLMDLSRRMRPSSQVDWTTAIFVWIWMNSAAGILGLGLRVKWWYEKLDIPWQPGHWLLCAVGAMGLWTVATQLVLLACMNAELNLPIGMETARTFLGYFRNIGLLLILIAAAVWMPFSWPWRMVPLLSFLETTFLLTAGVVPFGSLGRSYLLGAYSVSVIGVLMAIIAVTIWDSAKGPPRDWMHWAGLIAWAMLYIPELLAGPILWLTRIA